MDKTCHTVPMILVANSCLSALLCASDILWISIATLINDVKQIEYQNLFCIFCGYLTYVSCAVLNYSFLLQAFYRYMIVVCPTRLFWQLPQSQLLLIVLTWIYVLIFPTGFIFTGDIIYNMDNQICQIPLRFSFAIIFAVLCVYIIPVSITMFIYYKLVRFIHQMNQRIIPVNTLVRARRELKMFRRTVTLLMIIFILDFPYALFIFISFFNAAPKYHFRIAYIFVDIALACVMIVLFQFTDPLKTSILKKLNIELEMVALTES
ncbi:unnamed protein product [Adineta steineri]|uniref:G-protein coupled receptors family 1 profile domain-containing protein n=1 Tax=Adineta steineri TaxID=433720 RepID=A0A814KD08_9BILA|nr:unnamed protein product [Adineta steineri]CAF3689826.1 unnamed protein product [Adineta steineri]